MSRKILLIDDEADIREVAQMSLRVVGGWEVLTAASGPEGVAMARTERPDAILLDVMMPDMDGPATYRELQSHEVTRQIPVVLLTAKVQATEWRRFRDLGIQGIIGKPFDPMNLPRDLAAALGWA